MIPHVRIRLHGYRSIVAGPSGAAEEGGSMSSWPNGIDAITLFVGDLVAAKDFYQRVFGLPVFFEDDDSAVFNFGNTVVNLLKEAAATELIETRSRGTSRRGIPAPVHDRGGRRGRDVRAPGLARRAVAEWPDGSPLGVCTASFMDPGGHIWEIAHRLT